MEKKIRMHFTNEIKMKWKQSNEKKTVDFNSSIRYVAVAVIWWLYFRFHLFLSMVILHTLHRLWAKTMSAQVLVAAVLVSDVQCTWNKKMPSLQTRCMHFQNKVKIVLSANVSVYCKKNNERTVTMWPYESIKWKEKSLQSVRFYNRFGRSVETKVKSI